MARHTYEVEAEVVNETDAAWLLDIEGDEYWIPKSQIENNSEIEVGEVVEVIMTEWIAMEKGII